MPASTTYAASPSGSHYPSYNPSVDRRRSSLSFAQYGRSPAMPPPPVPYPHHHFQQHPQQQQHHLQQSQPVPPAAVDWPSSSSNYPLTSSNSNSNSNSTTYPLTSSIPPPPMQSGPGLGGRGGGSVHVSSSTPSTVSTIHSTALSSSCSSPASSSYPFPLSPGSRTQKEWRTQPPSYPGSTYQLPPPPPSSHPVPLHANNVNRPPTSMGAEWGPPPAGPPHNHLPLVLRIPRILLAYLSFFRTFRQGNHPFGTRLIQAIQEVAGTADPQAFATLLTETGVEPPASSVATSS